MSNLNKVMLIGRLGRDPEIKYAASGSAIANFTVATSRSWKDKTTAENVEETEWHRLTAFDRLAEVIGEFLKKGSLAYFEGRLKTRKWTDKDGIERYTTEIIVEQMQMLGGRDNTQGSDEPAIRAPAPAARSAARSAPVPTAPRAPPSNLTHGQQRQQRAAAVIGQGFEGMDDDIPF